MEGGNPHIFSHKNGNEVIEKGGYRIDGWRTGGASKLAGWNRKPPPKLAGNLESNVESNRIIECSIHMYACDTLLLP